MYDFSIEELFSNVNITVVCGIITTISCFYTYYKTCEMCHGINDILFLITHIFIATCLTRVWVVQYNAMTLV